MDRLAHVWIEVHWVNEIDIGIFLGEVLHGGHHTDEAVTKVLTSMASDENELLAIGKSCYVIACFKKDFVLLFSKGGIALELIDNHVEGIDNGVAGDEDLAEGVLCLEVGLREWSWREVVGGNATCYLTVHLLWPWAVEVVGAETCLNVTDRNLCIEGCKGSGCGGGGVAMNEYDIRTALLEDVTESGEDTCCDIGEVLTLFHDVEVVVRGYIEDFENLVEHFSVLTGDAHDGLELIGTLLELLDQRAHLDGLRTGSEY